MLERKQLANIGYEFVLEKLEPFSPFGEELARRQKPYKKEEGEALRAEFENIRLLAEAYDEDAPSFGPLARCLMQFKDIRRSLERSRETTLSEIELFELKRFLILLDATEKAAAQVEAIGRLGGIDVSSVPQALDIIDPDGLRTQTFRLPDSSSEALASIRRERKNVDIALRAPDEKNRDALSARRTQLAAMEENEELRLRGVMTKALSEYSHTLERRTESIARLDFALAKARLMLELGGTIPRLISEDRIALEDMVNPLTRSILKESGRDFTPVSISLEKGSTVITGANMGGKSVAVKTLALNAYLALSGFPVFCKSAELPMLSDIHLLSEDMEDSRGGLSSFGGEMVRFNSIIGAAEEAPGCLVLLDEFARGTNPHEGSALVRAAVRYFEEKKCAFALITTHFDDVACLAPVHYQVMGLRNADEAALEAALTAAGSGGEAKKELLSRFMDYGLFRADKNANPPRDALRICRALRINPDFMRLVRD